MEVLVIDSVYCHAGDFMWLVADCCVGFCWLTANLRLLAKHAPCPAPRRIKSATNNPPSTCSREKHMRSSEVKKPRFSSHEYSRLTSSIHLSCAT